MPRFRFGKLVRDAVLERCLAEPGTRVEFRCLELLEFRRALVAKLREEVDEIPVREVADDDVAAELADVRAALDALTASYGLEGTTGMGAAPDEYRRRAWIDWVEVPDDSRWAVYFRAAPHKYEELPGE